MGTSKPSFGTGTKLTTIGTLLGSEVWTDLNHSNTFLQSFVCDEGLQLVETPSIQPEIVPLAFLGFSYAFEVLQYNSSSIAVFNYKKVLRVPTEFIRGVNQNSPRMV